MRPKTEVSIRKKISREERGADSNTGRQAWMEMEDMMKMGMLWPLLTRNIGFPFVFPLPSLSYASAMLSESDPNCNASLPSDEGALVGPRSSSAQLPPLRSFGSSGDVHPA